MSSPETGKSAVTAAADLIGSGVGRHWIKRLARRLGVPNETARFWLYHRMPAARRIEIADAIIAECKEIEALLATTVQRCEGERNDETDGAVARGQAGEAGAATRRMGEAMRGRAMRPS